MYELTIVLKGAGIALVIILALHGIVRVGSSAYFRSKREHIRRINNEG